MELLYIIRYPTSTNMSKIKYKKLILIECIESFGKYLIVQDSYLKYLFSWYKWITKISLNLNVKIYVYLYYCRNK